MKILSIIIVKSMLVKYNLNSLEVILKNKFPEINPELYYSRRKKLVHMALDKCVYDYRNYRQLLYEISDFFHRHFRRDFIFYRPIRLVPTIKWKFDYVIFRKRQY